jgi:hypothetical protein
LRANAPQQAEQNVLTTIGEKMSRNLDNRNFEHKLFQFMTTVEGAQSSECLDDETLLDLVEHAGGYPNAAGMLSHIAQCNFCTRRYIETQNVWRFASAVHEQEVVTKVPSAEMPLSQIPMGWKSRLLTQASAIFAAPRTAWGLSIVVLIALSAVFLRQNAITQKEKREFLSVADTQRQESHKKIQQAELKLKHAATENARLQKQIVAAQSKLKQSDLRLQALRQQKKIGDAKLVARLDIPVPSQEEIMTFRSISPVQRDVGTPTQALRLLSPNKTRIGNLRPTFQWDSVANATYSVTIATLQDEAIARSSNINKPHWTPTTPLLPGQTYKWRVEATRAGKEILRSEVGSFSILPREQMEQIMVSYLRRGDAFRDAYLLKEAIREYSNIPRSSKHYREAQKRLDELN